MCESATLEIGPITLREMSPGSKTWTITRSLTPEQMGTIVVEPVKPGEVNLRVQLTQTAKDVRLGEAIRTLCRHLLTGDPSIITVRTGALSIKEDGPVIRWFKHAGFRLDNLKQSEGNRSEWHGRWEARCRDEDSGLTWAQRQTNRHREHLLMGSC